MGQFRYLFYQGTNVFFLLSGLAIGTSLIQRNSFPKIQWLSWWQIRLLRLYPLWLLVLLIAMIAYALNFSFMNLNFGAVNPISDFLLHGLMLHVYSAPSYYSINIAWWFQGIIVQCYLLTPLFVYLTRSKTSTTLLIGIALLSWLSLNIVLRFSFNTNYELLRLYLGQASFGWLWYMVGIVCTLRYSASLNNDSTFSTKWSVPIFFISLFYISGYHIFLSQISMSDWLAFIFSFLASAAMVFIIIFMSHWLYVTLSAKNGIRFIPLSMVWVGSLSYAAYLSHMFFTPVLVLPVPWLMRIAAYFAVVLIASYVLTRTENKIRFLLEKPL